MNTHRALKYETILIPEIPRIIEDDNVIMAAGQGKTPVSVLNDDHCEKLAFPYLFPTENFGYKVKREIPLSPVKYFNQRLLNFRQSFASDVGYIFFARSIVEQHHLRSSINISLHKVQGMQLTAGSVRQICKESVRRLLSNENVFHFMSSVKGTPAYWKQFLQEVLAIGKQLGIPTYFLTLSCADLRWDELTYIIKKLNNFNLTDEEIKNVTYEQQTKLLNNNPVLVARHFQYKVQVFFKKIVLDGPLGKAKYYALRIEFQERRSPHVHAFVWILDAPRINDETEYKYFVERTISAVLPDSESETCLPEPVKLYQIDSHSRTCRKYKKNKCRFSHGCFFSNRTII